MSTTFNHSPLARRLLAGTAVGLVFACGFARAQSTGPAPTELPRVTVEGERAPDPAVDYKVDRPSLPKLTQPLRDTPQSIDVVTRKVMDDQGVTTLEGALTNITGISLRAGEGQPSGDHAFIRGFTARSDMYLDGMRELGSYFRDTFAIDAVEVIKGPGSMFFGRGSTGGVINLAGKKPLLESFQTGEAVLGTDLTKRGTIDFNQVIDPLAGTALRINAVAHENEVAARDTVEYRRWGVAPAIGWGLGTDTRVTFDAVILLQSNIPDYGHPYLNGSPVSVDRSNFYGLEDHDYEHTETYINTLRFEHDFNAALSVRNQTRFANYLRDSMHTPPRNPNINTDTVSRNRNARLTEDSVLINQTDLTTRFATFGIGHTAVTGLELAHEINQTDGRSITGATATSLFNPNPSVGSPGAVRPSGNSQTVADSVGVYFVDTVKLSPQWEVLGGARYDYFSAEAEAASGAQHFERTDHMPSWRVGVVYKPLPQGSVYAAYGTSFNPSAEQLTLGSSTSATNSATVGPEKNESYEIGTKWDLFGEALGVRGALFRTNKTNARTEDPTSATDLVVLEGEQRVNGFEFEVSGRPLAGWQILAGYTFLDSEVLSSRNRQEVGKDLLNVPPHTFRVWTTYQVAPRVEIGGGMSFVDQQYANNTNTNSVNDYTLFDAMASYRLTDNVAFRLNALNLSDTLYYSRVYSGHAVPGAGRSVLLSAAFRF